MRAVGVKGEGLFPSFGMRTCDQVDKVAVRNEMRYFVSNHIHSVADYRRAETRTTPPRVIKWFRHGRRTEELFGDNIMVGKDDWWRRRRTESKLLQTIARFRIPKHRLDNEVVNRDEACLPGKGVAYSGSSMLNFGVRSACKIEDLNQIAGLGNERVLLSSKRKDLSLARHNTMVQESELEG